MSVASENRGSNENVTEKSEDKKNIEMEEREKMLNAENKAMENGTEAKTPEEKKAKGDTKEGMEVKPKKIPIGGIQMPGFFTRSKSKERCKEDGEQDAEGTDLIDQKEKSRTSPFMIKKLNPFRRSRQENEEEGGEKSETKERMNILETIRIPLVNVFPRKKKNDQNLENQTQAGLASMETLDDKSTDDKNHDEMKNVPLDDKKDIEKQEEIQETTWRQKIMNYKITITASLLFILLVIIIIAIAVPGDNIPRAAPIRDGRYVETVTSCGLVEGLVEDSAVAFRGIPYARPPIGNLRFKYAQPLNNLDYCWNGTFLAHNATDYCLQIHSNGSISGTEDCLTLDIVTPYVRYDNPLPVVVLIGAESLIGGSPGKVRPSARYARSKDVVFVRPNFRLGALGFLALDILSKDDYPNTSGNYGLSDILEALKWVKNNIEHFGGDPKSVTLFGHRAGATLVTALTTIPKANEYFTRAWASSGGAIYPKKELPEAQADNKVILEAVGCADVDCLRRVDATKLMNAIQDTWRKPQPDLPTPQEDPTTQHEWLVLDGRILREQPPTVWTEKELPVKLIIGSTAQAGSSEKLLMKHSEWSADLVRQHVKDSFLEKRNLTDDVLKRYPHTYKGLSSMVSDIRIVCPLFAISTQMINVPFYVVNQTRFEQDIADIESDVDAIFGRYEPKTPEQRRYVSAMQGLFYHYVWFGKVEHSNRADQKVLVVGQDVLPNATFSECPFWIDKNVVLTYAALD